MIGEEEDVEEKEEEERRSGPSLPTVASYIIIELSSLNLSQCCITVALLAL